MTGTGGVVDLASDGTTLQVVLHGAVDLAVREAAHDVWAALASGSEGAVAVDCRDVTFMDSTGLSVLVRLVRDARAAGRAVRLVGASRQVTEVLAVTGVDEWMRVQGVEGL